MILRFGPVTLINNITQLNRQFHVTQYTLNYINFFHFCSGNNQKFLALMTNKTLSIYIIKHSLKITLEYIFVKCQCKLFKVIFFLF